MENIFTKFIDYIKHLFTTPKAQAALNEVAVIIKTVSPIVSLVAALVPNKNFQEVVKLYEEWAIPFAEAETSDPTKIGNYLMNAAVSKAAQELPAVPVANLVAAVNLAYVGIKNS